MPVPDRPNSTADSPLVGSAVAEVGLFIALLALYLTFLTSHHSYDAVGGGVMLYRFMLHDSAIGIFHSYHLLYLPLGALFDWLLRPIGVELDPLTTMQLINAAAAAIAAVVFDRLARRLGHGPLVSAWLTLVFATGASYWYYATNAEPYPVSLCFLLAAFLVVRPAHGETSTRRLALGGVLLGLATAFHITCVVALPALILFTRRPAGSSWREAVRFGAVPTIVAAATVLTPYALNYALLAKTNLLNGLVTDLTATNGTDYRRTIWWSITGSNLLREWLAMASGIAPVRFQYVDSTWPAIAAMIRGVLLGLTLLPLILLRRSSREDEWPIAALTCWFGAAFLLFSTYNVASHKFVSYLWAPMLLLIGFAWRSAARLPAIRLVGLAGAPVVALGLLLCGFDLARQQIDPGTNPHLARATAVARHTGTDDLVVHLGRGDNEYQRVYIPYFSVRTSAILDMMFNHTRRTHESTFATLRTRIEQRLAAGHDVYLMSDVAEPGSDRDEFEVVHGLEAGSLQRFFEAFDARPVVEDPAFGRLWRIGPVDVAEQLVRTPS